MKLQKLYAAVKQVNEITRVNHYPKIASYLRFLQLATLEQYSPVEIFMEDLLNPSWNNEERNGMISKECFLHLQKKVNPASHWYLTEDKIAFHHHCIKNNLSVPELVAIFDSNGQSYWGNEQGIETKNNLLDGLARYPFDIIMKPVYGYHGKGVSALDFVDGVHQFTTDLNLSLCDVFSKILAENPDRYILQKRLYSHQAIAEFTGNTVLQSLRLITCLDENSQPKLIIRKIKLPKQGNLIDNFSWGTNEGRQCLIDEYGKIENFIKYDPIKKHLVRYDYIEDISGKKTEFTIPFWNQCVVLVLNAQKAFAPLRTIGWDVAVTNEGPFLIEGNVFWDPLTPQEGSMQATCQLLMELNVPLVN